MCYYKVNYFMIAHLKQALCEYTFCLFEANISHSTYNGASLIFPNILYRRLVVIKTICNCASISKCNLRVGPFTRRHSCFCNLKTLRFISYELECNLTTHFFVIYIFFYLYFPALEWFL